MIDNNETICDICNHNNKRKKSQYMTICETEEYDLCEEHKDFFEGCETVTDVLKRFKIKVKL